MSARFAPRFASVVVASVVSIILTACEQPRCLSAANCPAYASVCGDNGVCTTSAPETSAVRCQNGIDDDGDGSRDCDDPDCRNKDITGLSGLCARPGEGEGEGEGEGSVVAEGEGEGNVVAEGEGEGEGSVAAEGEGEGVPATGGGIAVLRSTAPGAVNVAVTNVVVTYVRFTAVGTGADEAGFYVQEGPTGPAIFVLAPTPSVSAGDVVSFTATGTARVEGRPRVTTFSGLTTTGTTNVAALAQDFGTKADLLTAIDSYEAELGTSTMTVLSATDRTGGGGFRKLDVTVEGIPYEEFAPTFLTLRMAPDVFAAAGLAVGCRVTVGPAPLGSFATSTPGSEEVQFTAWQLGDIAAVAACPAGATADTRTPTSVVVNLDRALRPGQTLAPSQFSITDGTAPLAVTAATTSADGMRVTLTTATQGPASYTLTLAGDVLDVFGSPYAQDPIAVRKLPSRSGIFVNEIDYNQTGNDELEFVEFINLDVNPISITNAFVVFVNGGVDGAVATGYLSVGLSGTWQPGGTLVVGSSSTSVDPAAMFFPLQGSSSLLQNGPNDGVLLCQDGGILAGLVYNGSIASGCGICDAVECPDLSAYGTTVADGGDGSICYSDVEGSYTTCATPTPGAR